ncbi:MAG: HAD family phosphatase [Tissierellia bacterium]|nr:HAD family phosphatase [Tissierellia bacterium]
MEAVAFDFDGTLIDSMGMWNDLPKNYLASKGHRLSQEVASQIFTMSLKVSIPFLKKTYGLHDDTQEILKGMGDILTEGYSRTLQLKPGAIEILDAFKNRGYTLVLATATNEKYVSHALKRFNLYPYFQEIQTCDNAGYSKDDPNFYRVLSKRLGLPLDQVYLFDDAPYALKAAQSQGMYTVGVKDTYNLHHWDKVKAYSKKTLENLGDWTFKE